MDWNKLIKRYDKGDYLGKILGFPEQCLEGWKIGKKAKLRKAKGIEKIFVTGMGGSGYVGEMLQKLFFQESKIPVFIEHGYILPKFVDKKTLCIIVSYSGNTEEAIGLFKKLKKSSIPTIGVTSNGYLKKACRHCIVVPGGYQPRQASGYLFFSTLAVLKKMGLSPFKEKDVLETVRLLKKEQGAVVAKAKANAKLMYKKTPVIYATESLQVSALRWQTELNEIAKVFCHWNVLPELQHNEINASLNLGKGHFFLIRQAKEGKKMQARINFMKKRIRSIGYPVTEIESRGSGLLAATWYMNYLGSMTAFYLSMLNRLDPTPVNLIQGMKAYLKKKA